MVMVIWSESCCCSALHAAVGMPGLEPCAGICRLQDMRLLCPEWTQSLHFAFYSVTDKAQVHELRTKVQEGQQEGLLTY